MATRRVKVKYLHLKDVTKYPNTCMHALKDYEYKTTMFEHYSFDHMVRQVRSFCPEGYKCVYPLALHHEVLWNPRGERDQVHHAIDHKDYLQLNWTTPPVTPVCVEIIKCEDAYDAAKGLVPLQASLSRAHPPGSPRHPGAALRLR